MARKLQIVSDDGELKSSGGYNQHYKPATLLKPQQPPTSKEQHRYPKPQWFLLGLGISCVNYDYQRNLVILKIK